MRAPDLDTPPPQTTATDEAADRRRAQIARRRTTLYRYAVVLALAALIVVFSAVEPTTFPTLGNLRTIVNSQGVLLVLALGLTAPLISGDFDLSIGATLGFCGTLVAALVGTLGWDGTPAMLVTLAAAVLIGLINGWMVVEIGINAFIATLASSTVLAGLTLYISNGTILTSVPVALENFAQTRIPGLGIGVTPIVGFILAAVLWYAYEHTPLGRQLFFVGEGREVARLVGLPVRRLRVGAFVTAAVFSGLAGLLLAGELGGLTPSVGPTFLLPAYAAAFLGATTIKPGRFNAVGTLVALYLLVVGVTGLELLGVASWVEQVFNGVALAVAVAFARLVSSERAT
jgi:ribose transport system permease protein